MRMFNKALAMLLALILVVGIAPVNAFATDKDSKTRVNTEVKSVDAENLKIDSEDISKRDEFTKVYKLEDGTFFEVRSTSPLHIKEDGKWVDAKTVFAPGKVKDVIGKCEKLIEKAEKVDSSKAKEETKTPEEPTTAAVDNSAEEKTEVADDVAKKEQETSAKETTEKSETAEKETEQTTEQKSKEEAPKEDSKKAEVTTTAAQKSGIETPKSSAPVAEDRSSDSDLVSESDDITITFLNDGTSGTKQSKIDKYNLMLLKVNDVASHQPNEVTISANITLDLTVSGSTPGLLYAYENTASMANVTDSDYNTFNYISNRDGHLVDLNTISSSDEYDFNITDIYNRWGKGIITNNGLTFITSSDYTAEIEDAFVTRRYKTVNPFDKDSTYHTVDMGMAGTVYIDDFTNSMVLARSEIGFSNGSLPVEITRITDYGTPDNSTNNVYGNYAHINYEGKIKKITTAANANDDDIYAWQFIDGRTIYFALAANETTASDTDDEGYTLSKPNADFTGATIAYVNSENSAENKTYKFNENGYLTEIASASAVNGSDADRIKITYITTGGSVRINYIQDGQLRRYYFNYSNYSYEFGGVSFTHRALKNITAKYKNGNGTYTTIEIDSESAICSYEYEAIASGQVGLKKATYPDSSVVKYGYASGVLSTIKDIDGRKLTLNYETSVSTYSMTSTSSISTVTETTPVTVNKKPLLTGYTEAVLNIDDDPNSQDYQEYLLKSSLSIDSSNSYQRVFTDQTGNKEIIRYDLDLKPVFYKDTTGEGYAYQYDTDGAVENLVHIGNYDMGDNLIVNGKIDSAIGNWQISGSANVKRARLRYLDEAQNYIMRMNGNVNGEVYASQVINTSSVAADSVIVIGADGIANAPVNNSNNFFGMKVYSCASDGSNESLLYSLPFDNTVYFERQSISGAFSLENTTNYIKVKLVFSQQDNIALFDNIFCYVDTNGVVETAEPVGPSVQHLYENNIHGMVTSHLVTNGTDYQAEEFSYNANNSITSHTDFNGQTTTYAYDDNTSLLGSKTGNYATDYTYNPIGLLKTVTNVITGIGSDPLIVSKSFSYEGNKVASVTQGNVSYNFAYDSFGNVKSINLNDSSDSTQSVAYMSSTKQDANTNVITYASGDCYKYISDNGKITQISAKRNGETEYSVVANYEYYASGKLKKLTDVAANREITYNEDGSYKIVNGLASNFNLDELQMYSYKKLNSNTEKVNLFDLAYTYRKNEDTLENGNKRISSTLKFKNYQPALTFTNPNPGPDEPETIEMPAIEGTVTTTQASTLMEDCFGRTQSVKSTVTTSDSQDVRELSGAYTYRENRDVTLVGSNYPTSNLIETYNTVFKKNNTKAYDLTFKYTYDNYHQVTEISYTDNLPLETEEITLAKYTYDVLGQLLTEYDLNSGEYNEYTYDNWGNILTKTMYDNTAFSFNDGQVTHPANYSYKVLSYTYDTSVYNKLTSYTLKQYDHSANSNTEVETTLQTKNLTYDALGNLNDYTAEIDGTSTNYDLCWAGDKLVLAAANNYGYSYQYDDSGRLIKKSKVDPDMTPEMEINYLWKGDMLDGYQINIYESFLTVTIKNLYDENNHLIGLNYHYAIFFGQGDQSQMSTEDFFPNDSIIWFINDGQGNVVGMYNDTGEISIGCSYNAGGNGHYEVELTDNYMADLEAKYNALYPNDPARALLQLELERARVQTVYKALSNRLFEETGYRSMIYDSDTGLIFSKGRYYSPFYSRFVNANPKSVLEHQDMPFSTNLYTYCFNNPVNYKGDYEPVFDCSVTSFREIRTTAWASKYFN